MPLCTFLAGTNNVNTSSEKAIESLLGVFFEGMPVIPDPFSPAKNSLKDSSLANMKANILGFLPLQNTSFLTGQNDRRMPYSRLEQISALVTSCSAEEAAQ